MHGERGRKAFNPVFFKLFPVFLFHVPKGKVLVFNLPLNGRMKGKKKEKRREKNGQETKLAIFAYNINIHEES